MSDIPAGDFSRALITDGPTTAYPARMRHFGKLVGTWDARGRRLDEATGEWAEHSFTWIVSFVLGGRAVQDVEVVPSAEDPTVSETVATALRVYDPVAGVVRVSFFSPAANQYANLVAIGWHKGIRQDGTQNDGRLIRWNFSEITRDGYTWDGWVSSDDAATWVHVDHVDGTRIR
ncbi:MAG: hypothetical protein EPN48_03245 [Microbacteriaceae bacterium]|nr:MAG: hypothetical protein EPN48_03245 [Microbacteriaceae bacterium]